MKWENKGEELLEFSSIWKNQKEVIVFGLGIWTKTYIDNVGNDLTIAYIIDNNEKLRGGTYKGILIISLDDYLNYYSKYKILVSTYYGEIAAQLKENKLIEDKDFCDMHKFISVWYWYNKGELHLTRVNTSITTKCTLKCMYCNMFIPFYKSGKNRKANEIVFDFELLFKFVKKIYAVSLLGGEPLIHPELDNILCEIATKFGNRISELSIITNGTILPNTKVIEVIKKYNIIVQVTDYNMSVSYKKNFDVLIDLLKENDITYRIIKSEKWLDFGFPMNPMDISNENVEAHMEECSPIFKGLNDRKLYYCHILWGANESGLFKEEPEDFIDLEQFVLEKRNPVEILEYSLGYMDKGYLSLCKKCAGCGISNKNYIEVGGQCTY